MRVISPKDNNGKYGLAVADIEIMSGTKEEVISYINKNADKQEAKELINCIMED